MLHRDFKALQEDSKGECHENLNRNPGLPPELLEEQGSQGPEQLS